ncbi:hypothetical protein [Streptomyces sp. AP-93]|uniref:hypothetical protein n=1 Tax=Streptomyces sp. AP-93 TaxID=2929048 RepID=UPI001FAE827E|nr:hypothetical protein [Streptomyces sp. AP-93]MCJ0868110.1 hypothetical protein [Streptomyces sp. AP-93]
MRTSRPLARDKNRNPAGTPQQRAVLVREYTERESEAVKAPAISGPVGVVEPDVVEVRGGLRGEQTRAFERLHDPAEPGTRWRMGRLWWTPSGVQTVVVKAHRLELVHNGSRPARCARISVYPLDAFLGPRRAQHRRLEVWVSSPKLSALLEPYRAWTPVRVSVRGRGAWDVVVVPKRDVGLWLAAHVLEQQEAASERPA